MRSWKWLILFIEHHNFTEYYMNQLVWFIIGSCWAENKTYLDRFQEHLNGKGGVYIKRFIEDGALKEDFYVELLGIYPLEECLEKETELAKTTLFPKRAERKCWQFCRLYWRRKT